MAVFGKTVALLFLLLAAPIFVSAAEPDEEQLYESYANVLSQFVDASGRVNYAGLKTSCDELRSFLSRVAELPREDYLRWNANTQIAFWINAYNAITLLVVVDHYPIRGGFFRSWFMPSNSIRQISGAQSKLMFTVMGQKWSLQQIEDEILRTQYREPRIHFALVDGAKSSPPLRREPYTGAKLTPQLEDQTRVFLALPANFLLDRQRKTVAVSELFDWYGDDFVAAYGSNLKDETREVKEQAVVNFLAQYAIESEKKILYDPEIEVSYGDFEWALNEQ